MMTMQMGETSGPLGIMFRRIAIKLCRMSAPSDYGIHEIATRKLHYQLP